MGYLAVVAAVAAAVYAWRLRSRIASAESARADADRQRDAALRDLGEAVELRSRASAGAAAIQHELDDLLAALARGDVCDPDAVARRVERLLSEGFGPAAPAAPQPVPRVPTRPLPSPPAARDEPGGSDDPR